MANPAPPAATDPAQIAAETERYKARLDFWKAIIVTGLIGSAATALGSVLSWSIQWKQVKLAESESEARITIDRQERETKVKLDVNRLSSNTLSAS